MKYQKLSKKAISCMFVAGIVELIIVGAMIGVGMYIGREEWWALLAGGIVLALNLLYVLISPKVRYERYRYILNEEEIDVIEGFIFTKRNIVPIERLHKIAVMKGPIDRAFGLAKVVVTFGPLFHQAHLLLRVFDWSIDRPFLPLKYPLQ